MVVLEDRWALTQSSATSPSAGSAQLLAASPRPPSRRAGVAWAGCSERGLEQCVGGRGQRQAGGLGCMTRGAVSFLSGSQSRGGAQGKDTWDPKAEAQQLWAGLQDGGARSSSGMGGAEERGETPTASATVEALGPPTPSESSRRGAAWGPQGPGTRRAELWAEAQVLRQADRMSTAGPPWLPSPLRPLSAHPITCSSQRRLLTNSPIRRL